MLVAIGIDCIDSYKSNYHTITTMMTPYPWVTDDELYMLMGTNEERQNKNVILFLFLQRWWVKQYKKGS
jgi:hypothetical protein